MHQMLELNAIVFFTLLVTFLKNGLHAAKTDKFQNCLTSDIIGLESIKHCQNVPAVTHEVGHGSICTIKCKNSAQNVNVSCVNGKWTDECTKHGNTQLILRKRRSSFLHKFFHAIGCFFWPGWSCRTKNSDSSPPVLIGCNNVNSTAKRMKLYRNVHWELPTVDDNGVFNRLTVHTSPRPPGSIFFEGTTKASHYALDRVGNLGKCDFNINVKVMKCKPIGSITGGYIQCLPANTWIYGTTCRISCYKGYNVKESSEFECNKYGRWNVTSLPSCQRVICDKLIITSAQTEVNCTDENYYGSRCTYGCNDGYGIPDDQSKVLYCKSNGKWSSDQPTCKDILPPEWSNCPTETYIQYADRNKDTTKLEMTEPEVTDNVDGPITSSLLSGPRRGGVVKTGSHVSIYLATDRAGNKAKQCHIKTIVKQITCPKLFDKPYTKIVCENGNRYGASCQYECADGSLLRGPSEVMCEKKHDELYGFWSWGDFEPYCEIMEICSLKLNPPANGALACDYWLGGKFCQMQCRKGYNIDPAYRMHQMFVCSEEGKWFPSTNIPDCTRLTPVSNASLSISIHYFFDGNCNEANVQLEIKENFIKTFKDSLYSQACEAILDKCQVENVQVLCGTQTQKRSADMMELQFKLKLISDKSFSKSTLSDFFNQVNINANNTDSYEIILNNSTKLIPLEIRQTSSELHCPRGLVPSYSTFSCAECQKGTFYDVDTKSCILCPKGSYQNKSYAEVCITCPIGTTTEYIGSTEYEDCKAACMPGYWSANGISPCIPCNRGTYQNKGGSTECNKCGEGKTISFTGADNIFDCKEFDIVFLNKTQDGITINVSNTEVVRNFKFSMWIRLADMSDQFQVVHIDDGTTNVGIVYYAELFYLLGSCFEVKIKPVLRSWNLISLTVYEGNVSFKVNNQQKLINESCVMIPANSKLYIGSNFTGKISQMNIWSVNASDTGISALGETCKNNDPGDILSWKQFENMDILTTTFTDVPSECDDFNECLNTTCKFGQCIDMLNDHLCVCDFGFTGIDCDKNIDDCVANICENNASCIDNIGSYDCLCEDNYKGEYCEITVVNGSWTEWNEWSHCSSSCDVGEKTRIRFCDNPPPLNGGANCQGNSTQIENCVIQPCMTCRHWDAPDNASLVCVNETDKDGINCTLTCNEGFEFDSHPRNYYYCGPSTFHLWEFETDDNPANRIPSCNAVKNASELIVTYNIEYAGLICNSEQTTIIPNSEMQRLFNLTKKNVKCILENVCDSYEFTSRHCKLFENEKREISKTNVELQAMMSCDPNQDGPEVCGKSLIEAVNTLHSLSLEGSLNIEINGTEYRADTNSSSVGSDITCPEGNEKVSYYCVPCGEGKYHDGTGCKKCDYGQYQSENGQVMCSKCPKNYTTLGRGSVSINECIDNIPPDFDGSCPENITIFVDIKSIAIEVSWAEPIPVDNSEDPPIVNLVSGSPPGSSFNLNTSTLIHYMATDKSGNNSTCKFYVHIKVNTEEIKTKEFQYLDAGTIWAITGGFIAVTVIAVAVVIGIIVHRRRMKHK